MIKNELFLLIKDALDAEGEVDMDSSADSIPEWDSLGHLSVLTALDNATDGKAASISDLADATSVTAIVEILEVNGLL